MNRLFLLFSLLSAHFTHAQEISDPSPFANVITAEDLKTHLYKVASKEFEGRETGTEGQRKAAAYIEDQFKALGLQPGNKLGYQLYYPIFHDSLTKASIEVNGQVFHNFEDLSVFSLVNHTATIYGSEVVFVGTGFSDSTRNDYNGLDVRGKIVLILTDLPGGARPGSGGRRGLMNWQETALNNGAAAILVVRQGYPQKFRASDNSPYLNGFKKVILPNTFFISDKVAEAIMGKDYEAATSGRIQTGTYQADVVLDFAKTIVAEHSSDVLGLLEGSDLKDQFVVLSAHYDHLGRRDSVIYYGADDDGSGTVSILQLAKAFAKAKADGKGPRRSILFLANSGEEKGLWGSEYYSEHPAYPLEQTTVDLNIDMIGRIDPNRKKGDSTNYVYVVGDDKLSSDLKKISEAQNKKHIKLELDYKFNDPSDPQHIYYRSDHYNFARKGVPIIFYFDGIHKDYHRPSDTPDKINYDLMERRARLVFYTAWEMANRNDMLKRDIPLN
ncbi:M28 family peptidase [Flavitalea sp. BT771]|uniref:M28 family peptidase n=1 Tax=Flavitalea sp. BT771 TaxID=3063329 RepID=UPI0026E2D419|nr:M28 family peptidase [Flavitalea sp. BT771]MDO6431254.1 M28 family peptidase [Flavitalea sp. BT771]MDV6220162.1 M28 family peptidase [Flavitalea sp. BT771]